MTAHIRTLGRRATGETSALAIRLSTLFWAALLLCFLAGLPILLGITWMSLIAVLMLAALLALPWTWLWRTLRHSARSRSWSNNWLRSTVGWWFFLCGLVVAPVYYLTVATAVRPAIVPTVTLSNGARTVVLQGMQHVGAERFYQAVVYDLEKALSEGYLLAYEGVSNSDPQADAWFRKTMSHGKDLGDSYRELGKACGLSYQIDYFGPLLADAKDHPDRHVTIDVNTRALMLEYNRLLQTDVEFAAAMRKREEEQKADTEDAPNFITDFIARQHSDGPSSQSALVGSLCRGVMTIMLRRSSAGSSDAMDPLLLDFRNRHLVTRLLEDRRQKIYVTYGAGHVPGVIELLQRHPGWKIESVKWMRTIEAPENLQGEL